MSITQTVVIPADRRLTIDVPHEVPPGPVILTFTPAGELRYNAETIAGMREVDNMIAGKTPEKWYDSLDEMLTGSDD